MTKRKNTTGLDYQNNIIPKYLRVRPSHFYFWWRLKFTVIFLKQDRLVIIAIPRTHETNTQISIALVQAVLYDFSKILVATLLVNYLTNKRNKTYKTAPALK